MSFYFQDQLQISSQTPQSLPSIQPHPGHPNIVYDGGPDKSITSPAAISNQASPLEQQIQRDKHQMVVGGTHVSPMMHRLGRAGEQRDQQHYSGCSHGGVIALEQQQDYPQAIPGVQGQLGRVGAVPHPHPQPGAHVCGDVLDDQSYATGGGMGTGPSAGLRAQQQGLELCQPEAPHRVPSGPQENALMHGITTEIHDTAVGVGRQVDFHPELESLSPQAPFDPNLVCPMCRRQFKIGEIQKYRQHVKTCHGT